MGSYNLIVPLNFDSRIYAADSDGGSPYAEVALPNIVAQQPYDVWLHLVVPANEANIALGNFMATLTLATASNSTIAVARKPVSHALSDASSRTNTTFRPSFYLNMWPLGHICIIDRAPWTSTYKCSPTSRLARVAHSRGLN